VCFVARHLLVWQCHYLSSSLSFLSPSPFKSVTSGLPKLPDATGFASRVWYATDMSPRKLRGEGTSSQAGRAIPPQGDRVTQARRSRACLYWLTSSCSQPPNPPCSPHPAVPPSAATWPACSTRRAPRREEEKSSAVGVCVSPPCSVHCGRYSVGLVAEDPQQRLLCDLWQS